MAIEVDYSQREINGTKRQGDAQIILVLTPSSMNEGGTAMLRAIRPFSSNLRGKLVLAVAFVLLFLVGLEPAWTNDWAYEVGDLGAVWGSASNDVFAVGKRGIILHFDGSRW
ncbi:MAG: hypothetical protein V2I40_08435, partial [Desulfobacteraceae bacterium]|nr:hypothetical protein [Desulfobacteraceae bacterium]